MKPNPHENPDLTAYALGELEARQAREIHDLLAACPAATHELEQVEAVTDALRHGAPIPQERLHPDQRHAVLYPAHLSRRIISPGSSTSRLTNQPQPQRHRHAPRTWPVAALLKAAAVVTLAGFAYLAGRQAETSNPAEAALAAAGTNTTAPAAAPTEAPESVSAALARISTLDQNILPDIAPIPAHAPASAASPVAPLLEVKSPAAVAIETSEEKAAATTTSTVATAGAAPSVPEKKSVNVVVAAATTSAPAQQPETKVASLAPGSGKAQARPAVLTTPSKAMAFVNASRHAVDQFGLEPALIRPLPPKQNKRDLLAAPIPLDLASASKDSTGNSKPRTPDLYIHSWRTESASCPWNDKHRLLRITIQLPADQPAATTAHAYSLRVAFDPNNVREYRQLCERHQPAAELRQAGMHEVWYEYLPNGDLDPDTGKTIATVTLDRGRFTTQTVGPFDSTKLHVQDRGGRWQQARNEFVFDSAVVGFGLLMRGVPQAEKLDHALVLALAEKSKGQDPTGDCARFIRMVKEAAIAAGF